MPGPALLFGDIDRFCGGGDVSDGDLRVRTRDLAATGDALRLLAGELSGAERLVDDHRRAVGHDLLVRRLEEFQGNWDDRRQDLVASIEGLGDAARAAADGFEEIERGLVAALEGRG